MEMSEIDREKNEGIGEEFPECSFSGNRILNRVIRQGLWREKDENGDYLRDVTARIVNKDAVIKLTREELDKREVDYDADRVLPAVEVLTEKARILVTDGTNDFIIDGILTHDAVELASRWTRSKDIQVSEDGEGAVNLTTFDVDNTTFPVDDEKRPLIIISRKSIINKINHYKDVSNKVKIEISDEDLLALSIRAIVIHEWAHSLETAIGIDYYQKVIKDEHYDDERDGWDALRSRFKVIWNQAKSISNPTLSNSSAQIESEAHGERFASGFEFETTRTALRKLGVKPEDADRFVGYILEDRLKRLSEFTQIRNSSGLEDKQLQTLCEDVNSVARETENTTVITKLFSGLGYNAPYLADQLKQMVHGSMDVLKDPKKIYGTLQQEKS